MFDKLFHKEELIYPGKDQCGNCHAYIGDDAYCRQCGTKAGEGAYEPYMNFNGCVYGPPPVERNHICEKCGYSWTNCVMIDHDRFCPKCGEAVKVIEEGRMPVQIFEPMPNEEN